MAFCPNCGTQNEDGAKFCANCASQLTPDTQNDGFGYNAGGFTAPAVAPAKKFNIISIIGALLLFISMFLPYIGASALGISVNFSFVSTCFQAGYGFWGVLCILLALATVLLSLVKMPKATIIPAAIYTIVFIIVSIGAGKGISYTGGVAGFRFGFYLTIISVIVIAVAPFVGKFLNKTPNNNNVSDTQQF